MSVVELPVRVRMVLHEPRHRFGQPCWRAAEVALGGAGLSGPVAPAGQVEPAGQAQSSGQIESLGQADPPKQAALPAGQRWVPGLVLQLTPDEASGYEHNLAAAHPKVFVMCRPDGDAAVPVLLTASYDAGLRMLDSGEQVDAVPLPLEMAAIVARYVEQNWARIRRDRQGERSGPRARSGGKAAD